MVCNTGCHLHTVCVPCILFLSILDIIFVLLQYFLFHYNPLVIGINVHRTFNNYDNGIYDVPNCSPTEGLHAVLLVGYGTANGVDYWTIKNR